MEFLRALFVAMCATAVAHAFDVSCTNSADNTKFECDVDSWKRTSLQANQSNAKNFTVRPSGATTQISITSPCLISKFPENMVFPPNQGQYDACNGTLNQVGEPYRSVARIQYSCGGFINVSSTTVTIPFRQGQMPTSLFVMSTANTSVYDLVGGSCVNGLKFRVDIIWPQPTVPPTSEEPTGQGASGRASSVVFVSWTLILLCAISALTLV